MLDQSLKRRNNQSQKRETTRKRRRTWAGLASEGGDRHSDCSDSTSIRLSTTASPRTSIHRRPPPSSHPISFTASPTRPRRRPAATSSTSALDDVQRFLLQRRPPIGIDFAFEIDFATCQFEIEFAFEIDFATCQFEIDFASSEFEIDFATCEPEHYYLNLKSVFLPVNLLTSPIGIDCAFCYMKSILLLLLSNRYRLCVYMLKSNLKMGFLGCLLRFFTASGLKLGLLHISSVELDFASFKSFIGVCISIR
ncbi:hypothetical protein LXL04_034404 [Taraxacum kok-saghyz]